MDSRGRVELWHRDCWNQRDEELETPTAPAPIAVAADSSAVRPSRSRGLGGRARLAARIAAAVAAVAVVVAAGVALALRWPVDAVDAVGAMDANEAIDAIEGTAAGAANEANAAVGAMAAGVASAADAADAAPPPAIAASEPLSIRSATAAREDAPPRKRRRWVEEPGQIPLFDGTPLDELYPTLKDWIHPVTASAEHMPTFHARLFGARREAVARTECGRGHCGVDLDGPRGRPIVAVAAGVVIHVDRRLKGGDGRSGRYVRLQHEDGTFTAYMHMDAVADGLEPGTAVRRGQYLGTLGATAVYAAPPHLHFSLEIPTSPKLHGDHVPTRYVNPAPFLMRSKIVPVIQRRSRPALN